MHFIVNATLDGGKTERRSFDSQAEAETSVTAYSLDRRCVAAIATRSDNGEFVQAYRRPLEQTPVGAKPARDGIALQNAEFDALAKLIDATRIHHLTSVVDDDYPEVRQGYERALRAFLAACKANGRTL